ncbi:MAG: hypothetical protein Q8P39_01060 [Candidatus Yanofskybacteria bacterium]|nr:hypothetical protein [Candidatus Yanofskybacteria bacterium]
MHSCKAVAVHCIDFRIQKYLNTYLDTRYPENYDLLSLAGGIKHLLDDGEQNNVELGDLLVSDRLHHPDTIILIQHEDCGAYGGSQTFAGFEEETQFQREQLDRAEVALRAHFPNAAIEKLLIRLSGDILPMTPQKEEVGR